MDEPSSHFAFSEGSDEFEGILMCSPQRHEDAKGTKIYTMPSKVSDNYHSLFDLRGKSGPHRERYCLQQQNRTKRGVLLSINKAWRTLPYHWLLPVAFFCVGLVYLYASPHFEASDNVEHAGMIKWVADYSELPVQTTGHDEVYGQEASQPPLYYFLMAPIWSFFDTSDFDESIQRNPLVYIGYPLRRGNKNLVFYQQPYPPDLQGASLALYVIRVLTLAMGAVAVAAVYQSARTIMPNNIGFAVLATSLTAFNPMFVFTAASVSNDNLVTMLAALIAWGMLVMLRDGFYARSSLVLALLIALASLAKLSGLVTGFVVGLAAIWVVIRSRDWRGFVVLGASLLVVWLIIAGWWYLRNLILYGELFGTGAMLDNFGRREITLPRLLLEEFEGLRISYWALFGVFNTLAHKVFYVVVDGLSLAGAAGLIVFLVKSRRNEFMLSTISFLGILLAIGSIMLIWWSLQTPASIGRLLFPFSTSISVLLALGLYALRIPTPIVAAPLFLFALLCPFLYIMPQYDHPPTVVKIPESATGTFARWEDITLIGYEIPKPRRWSAGDEIPFTLYWQPLAQSSEPQALFLTLIDADGMAVTTIDTFPGWGTLPTTWWEPGAIYRDDYILQIPKDVEGFSSVQLHIGWSDLADRIDIMPVLETGEETAAFTLPIGALVADDKERELGSGATAGGTVFGEALKLNRYRFRAGRILELEWRVLRELSGDWRAFAIVLDKPYQDGVDFEVIFQNDQSAPVPLDFLKVDETFITRHNFQLPADYQARHGIYVGWYNETLGIRLEAPQPQNMLELRDFDFSAASA